MRLQFVEAGEIVSSHGVRGEAKVLCWLDDPEMLCEFDRCVIDGKEMIMEQVRVQKTCNLVKFQGVDTMEAAQAMRGKVLDGMPLQQAVQPAAIQPIGLLVKNISSRN